MPTYVDSIKHLITASNAQSAFNEESNESRDVQAGRVFYCNPFSCRDLSRQKTDDKQGNANRCDIRRFFLTELRHEIFITNDAALNQSTLSMICKDNSDYQSFKSASNGV